MKTFVIGDIHGAYKALSQCLQRADFDYKKDRLIALGDVCDGWPEVNLAIDELLKIDHLEYILGNHDLWTLDWATKGIKDDVWIMQGGENTILSYKNEPMPQPHIEFLKQAKNHVECENSLFVHAGIDPHKPMAEQQQDILLWDRDFLFEVRMKNSTDPSYQYTEYDEIYIGHTPTQLFHSSLPLKLCNVWVLDTGAGWNGKLSIMDIQSKQYWQSDPAPNLYPGITGRIK